MNNNSMDTERPGEKDTPVETPTEKHKISSFDYDAVVQRCMGDTVLANRLIQKLAERVEHDLEKLRVAFGEEKGSELARLAHKLKGAASNLEVESIVVFARQLEQIGRSGDLTQANAIFSQLERATEVYRGEVRALLRQ